MLQDVFNFKYKFTWVWFDKRGCQSMTLTLEPDELEIESLAPGPIIHIFPKINGNEAAEDILKGLFLLKRSYEIGPELDEILKNKEQPEYLILAFTEIKRLIAEAQRDAEKSTLDFISKVDDPPQ